MNPTTIDRISQMLVQWQKGQPLAEDSERVLQEKQNLLWSYNSNHLEGNTLTYGETELLLIHGKTNGMHPVRDVDEMRAHHVAVKMIREWAKESREITESDIRDLNKILLKEPFMKEAVTADGQPARKRIIPGDYKLAPNHVKTQTGEIFRFAEPFEVPAKMADFVRNLRKKLPDESLEIAKELAALHHEFILIHPFDDGNGRTVRLLLNYVLLRDGYPAIVIKSEDKSAYLNALQMADVGDLDNLTDFLLICLEYALELGIKAINGESLREPEDVDMKLELLKRSMRTNEKKEEVTIEEQMIFCQSYIHPFVKIFESKFAQLDSLLKGYNFYIQAELLAFMETFNTQQQFLLWARDVHANSSRISKIYVNWYGEGLKSGEDFEEKIINIFDFEESGVKWNEQLIPYHTLLAESEGNELVSRQLDDVLEKIKAAMNRG